MKFVIIGAVFLTAVGTLLTIGFMAGNISHYQIPELTSAKYQGEECRVDGTKILTIDEDGGSRLRFTVESPSGATMNVVSKRRKPDNFKEGAGVGLRGYYRSSKDVFEANDITTSCPSKYEGEDGKYKAPVEMPGVTTTPES